MNLPAWNGMPFWSKQTSQALHTSHFAQASLQMARSLVRCPSSYRPPLDDRNFTSRGSSMKRTITASACLSALVGLTALAPSQALAQQNIAIAYEQPKKAEFGPILDRLRKRKVLETLQQFLSPLQFPMTVKTAECGAPYASYKAGGPIIICYEYVGLIESVLPAEKDPSNPTMPETLGRIGANPVT